MSSHRREIAPGIIAMPNMSRRSLEKHRERIDMMIQQNPSQEIYIRQRYQSAKYSERTRNFQEEQLQKQFIRDSLCSTSEDEADYLFKYQSQISTNKSKSVIVRIITYIVNVFSYLISFSWNQNERVQGIQNHHQGIFLKIRISYIMPRTV